METKLSVLKSVLLLISLTYFSSLSGQTLLIRPVNGETKISVRSDDGTISDYTPEELTTKVNVAKGLTFDASAMVSGVVVKISKVGSDSKPIEITGDKTLIGVNDSGDRYIFSGSDPTIKVLQVDVTPKGGKLASFVNIGSKYVSNDNPGNASGSNNQVNNNSQKYSSWREFVIKNSNGAIEIIKGSKRYFPNSDKAYICIDPYGNIIGRKPVNLDQDDEIIFLVIVPVNEYDAYSIDDNNAEYAPTDLAFRPATGITPNAIQSGSNTTPINYTVKEFIKGPYTTSDIVFDVKKAGTTLNTYSIHINPLYHVAIGVSYVSSNLEDPSFDVVPMAASPGMNTIQSADNSSRTFITFNVIWYWWSTLRYIQGDPLTRGRDVLKEPNFITRINPTFGVSLKGNLQENFIAGLTFEFARGGSICAGWHYGKITQLTDRNFQLGTTQFGGTQADIKTEDVWKWGNFIGITLDTRIFNRLFNRSTTGN